jgi:hypothetical protein
MEELIDFKKWCRENTTDALYNGIDLAVTNYIKSINSASHETRSVSENEHQEKDCGTCWHKENKSYHYPCKFCDSFSRWEQSD